MLPVAAWAEQSASITTDSETQVKETVLDWFSSIAGGEVLDNQHFVFMTFSAIVYAQEGYVDTSQPLTQEASERLLNAPPFFGALLYLHREKFAGDWKLQIRIFDDEIATVKATNGHSSFKLMLVKSLNEQWGIDMDNSSYNSTRFPVLFGYTHGSPQPYLDNVPVELPESELRKVRAVIATQTKK